MRCLLLLVMLLPLCGEAAPQQYDQSLPVNTETSVVVGSGCSRGFERCGDGRCCRINTPFSCPPGYFFIGGRCIRLF
ncbi:hypothetical protein FJT64_009081 [Amphibalanus amphitrite]|uniref:Uncharacterized protein n=1 Tax=Amphibalanus amphitrite TaxID=1232801 RepID=A0A6A4VN07_AMPAM|nr:hypothetical protein FJT64_009081 [Amphibalanus amphitrite]